MSSENIIAGTDSKKDYNIPGPSEAELIDPKGDWRKVGVSLKTDLARKRCG